MCSIRCCTCRASWSPWLGSRLPQALAPESYGRGASSRRGPIVRRITLGEENGSTEHKAMTLAQAQGHGAGHGELPAASRHLCRRQSEHTCETRTREGQALRSLKIQLVHIQKLFARRRSRAPRCLKCTGGQSFRRGLPFVGFARRGDNQSNENRLSHSHGGIRREGFHAGVADIVAPKTRAV